LFQTGTQLRPHHPCAHVNGIREKRCHVHHAKSDL
jgi:hypothetical protein